MQEIRKLECDKNIELWESKDMKEKKKIKRRVIQKRGEETDTDERGIRISQEEQKIWKTQDPT